MSSVCPHCQTFVSPKTRFCTACGEAIEAVKPQDAPRAEEPAPLSVKVYFPHLLVAGHPSMLKLRVQNNSGIQQQALQLRLECRAFAGTAGQKLKALAPSQQQEVLVEIEPERAGHSMLQVSLYLEERGQGRAYRGSCPVRILEVPDTNIVISIGDIQCNAGGSANAGLGAEYGDVHISNLLGATPIKTLNDLLALELPEAFLEISLELDESPQSPAPEPRATHPRSSLHLAKGFAEQAEKGSLCRLISLQGEEREWRLVSRRDFRIGRSRTEADHVSWLWPRSPSHDARTRRISKLHVQLRAEGDTLLAWDLDSPNASQCDERLLGTASQPSQIAPGSRLKLAGEYQLQIEEFSSACPRGLKIPGAKGKDASDPSAHGEKRGCLRFHALNSEPSPYSALWLFSDAAFGADKSNALVFEDSGMAGLQGRLHHHEGAYWLENTAENEAVSIDEQALRAGELVPLRTGMKLVLGNQAWRIEIER